MLYAFKRRLSVKCVDDNNDEFQGHHSGICDKMGEKMTLLTLVDEKVLTVYAHRITFLTSLQ